MKLTSLLALRNEAKSRCDQVNTQFVTDAEWNVWINRGIDKLHNFLVNNYGNDYFIAEETIMNSSIVDQRVALPSNFYKLMGVDIIEDSNNSRTVYRFQWADRNRYDEAYSSYLNDDRYRIIGNDLHILNQSNEGNNYRIWFVPVAANLVNDTDMLDGLSGYDDYVVVDAARKAALKEESFELANFLAGEQKEIEELIKTTARNRDISGPGRVQRTRRRRLYDYGFNSVRNERV